MKDYHGSWPQLFSMLGPISVEIPSGTLRPLLLIGSPRLDMDESIYLELRELTEHSNTRIARSSRRRNRSSMSRNTSGRRRSRRRSVEELLEQV